MQLINYSKEDDSVKKFFGNKNVDENFLKNYRISYIFTDKEDLLRYDLSNVSVIYTSGNIEVLKFDNLPQRQ